MVRKNPQLSLPDDILVMLDDAIDKGLIDPEVVDKGIAEHPLNTLRTLDRSLSDLFYKVRGTKNIDLLEKLRARVNDERIVAENHVERNQIEEVFGVHGNLEDEPLAMRPHAGTRTTAVAEHAYWYEGCPDYMEGSDDPPDQEYTTLIMSGGGFLPSPKHVIEIVDDPLLWILVASYMSSGEAECPLNNLSDDRYAALVASRPCIYCDADEGEEHGYIYLGEGYEAVYKQLDTRDTREVLSRIKHGEDPTTMDLTEFGGVAER